MLLQALFLLIALAVLYYGAETTLNSAEKIGVRLGLSPLVVGLLIVGFGTSLPEFFVSQISCYRGHPEIALGNIIGSNIANLFLILGVAGLIVPLCMKTKAIREQVIFHLILTVLLILSFMIDGFSIRSVIAFIGFFIFYLYYTFKKMRERRDAVEVDVNAFSARDIIKLLTGFVMLYGGGELLVSSGTKLGMALGISEFVLSAIIVAFGTSFPELMTAFVACLRKKNTNLITGNIIGSNVFNVAFVLSSIGGYGIKLNSNYFVELMLLLFAALFLMVFAFRKMMFSKLAGVFFLLCYLGMVFYWIK